MQATNSGFGPNYGLYNHKLIARYQANPVY